MEKNLFLPVVKPYRITSLYGERKSPDPRKKDSHEFHDGMDIVSDSGINTVFAVADGVVEYDRDNYDHSKRWETGGTNTVGNRIVLLHTAPDGKKWRTLYFHLVANTVSLGQIVKKGQSLGTYGDVGYSFGAHLHLKFVTGDDTWTPFDPKPFIQW